MHSDDQENGGTGSNTNPRGSDEDAQAKRRRRGRIMARVRARRSIRRVPRIAYADGAEWSRQYRLSEAAKILRRSAPALRGWIHRRAHGSTEFEADGVRGHKLGRCWLVQFDRRWSDGARSS